MRPLKLTMSAFGPFAGVETIDFGHFGNEGIYLVTGETGSGKTTVFDAISFALYGRPSGAERDPKNMRSDFADADTPTFVELTFEYRGETYTVRRNPAYDRPKKRGDGFTSEKAQAELARPDKPPVVGEAAVTKAICDLLGIDLDQFSQIVMVAQGDFRKLLSATTDNRSAIFRKLFSTGALRNLQEDLKVQLNAINKEFDSLRSKADALAGSVATPEKDARAAAIADARERNAVQVDELIEMLRALDEEDDARLKELKAEESALNKTISELNRSHAAAEEAVRLQRAIEQLRGDLAQLDAKTPSLEEALAAQEARDPERKELARAIAVDEEKLPRYEELARAQEEERRAQDKSLKAKADLDRGTAEQTKLQGDLDRARDAMTRSASAEGDLSAAKAACEQRQNTLDQIEAQVALHDDIARNTTAQSLCEQRRALAQKKAETAAAQAGSLAEQKSKLVAQCDATADAPAALERARATEQEALRSAKDAQEHLQALDKLQVEKQAAQAELDKLRTAYTAISKRSTTAQERAIEIRQAYLDSQAGFLAEELKDGEPCPVCGSVHHPSPAALAQSAPRKSDVDAAAEEERKAVAACNEAREIGSSANQKVQGILEREKTYVAEHGDRETLEKKKTAADTLVQAAAAAVREAQAAERAHAKNKEELAHAESALDNATAELESAREAVATCEKDGAAIQACIDALQKQVDPRWPDAGAAAQARATALESLAQAQSACERAQKGIDAHRRATLEVERLGRATAAAESNLQTLQAAQSDAAAQHAGALERVKTLQADLNLSGTLEQARADLDKKKGAEKRMQRELDRAQRERDDHERRRAETAARLQENEAKAQQNTAPSLDQVEEALEAQTARRSKLAEQTNLVFARQQSNIQARCALQDIARDFGHLNSQFAAVDTLARTANGNLSGKDRVDFETYVQAVRFDQVLAAANVRLDVMSQGRYRLVRRTVATNLRSKTGLDLDVLDFYSGKAREASTLSGGESFMASLSLALGLSDVVQANAGGIQLDTMFVDEGFGTLDQEALQLAVKTLNELCGGGKLVGIISHVDQLKESIDRKVVVERGRAGSHVRLEA